MLDREEVLWKQRAKTQWIAEGDRNTKFFHAQASRRAAKNEIRGLKDKFGELQSDLGIMGNIAVEYHEELFSSIHPATQDIDWVVGTMKSKVDHSINRELSKDFTPLEVLSATQFSYFTCLCWGIWYHRNQIIHSNNHGDPHELVNFATEFLNRFKAAQQHFAHPRPAKSASLWSPPEEPYIKINVDAAILKSVQAARLGIVAQNGEGEVLAWRQRKVQNLFCPEIAETIDVKHGIELALAFGWKNVIVESDFQSVVKAINSTATCLSPGGHFIDYIKSSFNLFDSVSFLHVFRSANTLAHDIAQQVVVDRDGLPELP